MMVWSTSHQANFDILTMMSRECNRLDPSYQRRITFAYTGLYQLHPHHRIGIITPTYRRYQVTDLECMGELGHNVRT